MVPYQHAPAWPRLSYYGTFHYETFHYGTICFSPPGICDLEVKETRKTPTKKRDADELDPNAGPARKKIKAKVCQELSQLFTQK